jgi:hypothetical protein
VLLFTEYNFIGDIGMTMWRVHRRLRAGGRRRGAAGHR